MRNCKKDCMMLSIAEHPHCTCGEEVKELQEQLSTAKKRERKLWGALEEIHVTSTQQCNCEPNGGLYACELHKVIAEEILQEEV